MYNFICMRVHIYCMGVCSWKVYSGNQEIKVSQRQRNTKILTIVCVTFSHNSILLFITIYYREYNISTTRSK